MAVKKMQDLKIALDSAVLIINADKALDIVLPDHDAQDVMPMHVVVACAIAQRVTSDPDWVAELVTWYDNLAETARKQLAVLVESGPEGGIH